MHLLFHNNVNVDQDNLIIIEVYVNLIIFGSSDVRFQGKICVWDNVK